MEIWKDNDLSKGIRPQVQAYHLETEPWTFLIDRNGIVRDRIEGAYGVSELEEAMRDDRSWLNGRAPLRFDRWYWGPAEVPAGRQGRR